MRPPVRWRSVAVLGFTAGLLPPLAAVHWARARAARTLAERDATAVAAYLALVTPGTRRGGSADYNLPQLLIRAHALDGLPDFAGRFEVYHATAPLVRATAPPLSAAALEQLRHGVAVRWIHEAHASLAPLLDRNGWDVVGAVAARADGSEWSFPPWLIAAWLLLLVAAGQAVRAMGGAPGGAYQALRRYGAAAALFGAAAFAGVRLAAADATDRWLDDVRLLLQEAAVRVPDVRSAPGQLAGIARSAEIVPTDSGSVAPRRRDVAGAVRAAIVVRLAPGRWVELRSRPGEDGTIVWLPLLLGVASLGPLSAWLGVWGSVAAPRRRRETITAWAFLAPSALHLVALSIIPLLVVPYLSVHRWSPAEPVHPFVGIGNYASVLGDPTMWSALGHTLLYACSVPVSLALGLGIALLLGRDRGSWVLSALLLPSVASVVAIGLVWQRLLHPDVASMDGLLARVGLAPLNWLGGANTALASLLVVGAWMQLGYHVTLFHTGLRNIPPIYHDAALVDGAGAWQRFRRVTLPLLRPVALFGLLTGLVSAFQVFTLAVVLTGGGPRQASDVITYHIYRTAWERLQFGEASAQALLLFALLVGAIWMLLRLFDRQAEHA
jgi:multiple sugar transport system permease protein